MTRPARITVVGDLLLDRDVLGNVERVCPDAPVPVVDVVREAARPGGAGLAATLLVGDGHEVTLIATVGEDPAGRQVAELVTGRGVRLVSLPTDGTTREKVRIRSGGQSLLRLDRGTACPPAGDLPAAASDALSAADAVLVCDYAGGVTDDPSVRAALSEAAAARPVVWDPHGRGAPPVPGCSVVTPNQSEAAALAAVPTGRRSALAAAQCAADDLLETWQARAVCVTLGARGALLSYGSGAPLVVPAEQVEAPDTCGAGDRFASAVTAALAEGEILSDAVQRAVGAATVFVAAGGAGGLAGPVGAAVPPAAPGKHRLEQVRAAGGTVVATGGCFDLLHAGHVALLRAARALGDCLVVCLNSDDSVRRLKGAPRPLVPQGDRARVLEALECVDAVVVFSEDTPERVLDRLRPDIWAKGGDYSLADLPETRVLDRWGGQTVVLPYLDGRSTTGLIGAARGRATTAEENA
ncbi:MAG: D-glycero-beta-D-manno-heptose 1-phosphate adenylyltransferase [Actinomycetota bacterium]|nr:D-glycero-beta-D-manno-heptose 1-phosphate adenylyltransferase [Actinomycetota bacterium]